MRPFTLVPALALSLSLTGCPAFIPGLLYADVTTSHNFYSLTESDPAPAVEARGEACFSSVLGLVSVGNGGSDAAYRAALASVGANSLYDVRVDLHVTNYVLGIYSQVCTVITGKASH